MDKKVGIIVPYRDRLLHLVKFKTYIPQYLITKKIPFEIIIVDGGSKDNTIEIAKAYTDKIFSSNNSNLTKDRQIGITNCQNELVAMIDSDHILMPGDLSSLVDDLFYYNLDIVQSGLEAYELKGFWVKAENEACNQLGKHQRNRR